MRLLLMGSTDLTHAIAEKLKSMQILPVGCSSVAPQFNISYSPKGVTNIRASNMQDWSSQNEIPFHHFENNKNLKTFATDIRADFALVAGWYHMVPKSLRSLFPLGCAGLHASYLPDLRGGAPLNWAILSGREQTAMSLFELDDGVDDGLLYGQELFKIDKRETIQSLINKAEVAAIKLIERCIPNIATKSLIPYSQVGTPTYCQQRSPEDSRIHWNKSAVSIDRLTRAVGAPYNGAFSYFQNQKIIIWKTEPYSKTEIWGMPGQIALLPGENTPFVCTGDGILRLISVTNESGEDYLPILLKSGHQRLFSTERELISY